MSDETVLVTGGSGFIAAHCIVKLLEAGYRVRTTVRAQSREADVVAMVKAGGADPGDRLTFAVADLLADDGWSEAAVGCSYVLHVASPLEASVPKDENDLIRPARDGALRVLVAARDAGVKRVVLTSSFAAVGYGTQIAGRDFTEADWTNPATPGIGAYVKSKAIAERAAWDFMAREGGAMELSAVNPVAVLGPVLGQDFSTSILLIQMMMAGRLPAAPKLMFGLVDVRDVADLHLLAMTHPAAKGERFLACSGDFMTVHQIARVVRERLGPAGARAPRFEAPSWAIRLIALVNPMAKAFAGELDRRKNASSAKAQKMLGWSPRPSADAIVATAKSLLRFGVVPPR